MANTVPDKTECGLCCNEVIAGNLHPFHAAKAPSQAIHQACKKCAEIWPNKNNTCPFCRVLLVPQALAATRLVMASAIAGVEQGLNIIDLAGAHGIRNASNLLELERRSIRGAAGAAITNGENIQEVAQRFGIQSEAGLLQIERLSINGPARDALRNGMSVEQAATRFGITSRSGLSMLQRRAR